VDDILTGLDSSAQWALDQIGIFGLLCLGVSATLLCLLIVAT
jgi:hypothetical protein